MSQGGSGREVTVATKQWYAVETLAERTGVDEIVYVQADNSQGALAFGGPGASILGGPYATEAAAEKAFPQGSHGTRKSGSATPSNPPTGNALPANPLGGLAAVGDFFQRLTQAHTWERVGEVVLGLLLIAVGVAHMTHAVPIATKIAGAVALA
jgi:hypothetical protein